MFGGLCIPKFKKAFGIFELCHKELTKSIRQKIILLHFGIIRNMELSEKAILNLRRLWMSPLEHDINLAMSLSGNALLLHEHLMPEVTLALEFHPKPLVRAEIKGFLKKWVYGVSLKEEQMKVMFFKPPHSVYHYKKFLLGKEVLESYFLDTPHLYEHLKSTAEHCSYAWGMREKLEAGLYLWERIAEKEPESGDVYFFIARCHHYIFKLDYSYGATRAIKAYRKAGRMKTTMRRIIKTELESLLG